MRKEINQAIEKRIQAHIEEHKGLYTTEEVEILKPVWRRVIIEQVFNK